MYKQLSLLVLLALAAVVLATETQDQAAAEQYFGIYGSYPAWYNPALYSGVRGYPGLGVNPTYGGYPGAYPGYAGYAGYNGLNAFRSYPAGYASGYNYYY